MYLYYISHLILEKEVIDINVSICISKKHKEESEN